MAVQIAHVWIHVCVNHVFFIQVYRVSPIHYKYPR